MLVGVGLGTVCVLVGVREGRGGTMGRIGWNWNGDEFMWNEGENIRSLRSRL